MGRLRACRATRDVTKHRLNGPLLFPRYPAPLLLEPPLSATENHGSSFPLRFVYSKLSAKSNACCWRWCFFDSLVSFREVLARKNRGSQRPQTYQQIVFVSLDQKSECARRGGGRRRRERPHRRPLSFEVCEERSRSMPSAPSPSALGKRRFMFSQMNTRRRRRRRRRR